MNKNLAKETVGIARLKSARTLRNETIEKHCEKIAQEILRILGEWSDLKEQDKDLPKFSTHYRVDDENVDFYPAYGKTVKDFGYHQKTAGLEMIIFESWWHCTGHLYLVKEEGKWMLRRTEASVEQEEGPVFDMSLLKYSVPRIRRAWREWLERRVEQTEQEAQKALEAL